VITIGTPAATHAPARTLSEMTETALPFSLRAPHLYAAIDAKLINLRVLDLAFIKQPVLVRDILNHLSPQRLLAS